MIGYLFQYFSLVWYMYIFIMVCYSVYYYMYHLKESLKKCKPELLLVSVKGVVMHVQSFERDKCWCFTLSGFYLFCKKSNWRLEFTGTVFISFVSKEGVRHGYMGGGGHVFFAKLPYIFIKKILFSYIIFVKSGLTACYLYLWYSLFQAQWDICNQWNHQA